MYKEDIGLSLKIEIIQKALQIRLTHVVELGENHRISQ